ncbi:LysM peptidoglycan-binding domain-containing protein [Acinetobacter colistiniresistens]|uniref:LysM peptidoglycan-binding domain-containing protein n=1 Tax=Acinetobacter colistiniresistens TaxID=280145 RepID=UPI00211C2E5A|nr:LysM peptidoglycan-binding domain-containing protein [Acinetobacter colistiniresistens]UUM26926.1 LysM peptidoglycan-binding domain-containing protein [Acinetobacter colistiniresistens]
MDCLANIKFLDALDQPIQGLAHQLWIGPLLISDYISSESGESVWIKRPIGTVIDVRVRSMVTGEYNSQVKIQLIGEKTVFIVRSPKILLKGVNLSAKDVATGNYFRSTYIVAEGDYLGRIADDNDTTTDELIRINNLKSDTDIRPGQVLKIPVKKAEAPVPPPEAKPKPQIPKPNRQEKTKIIVVQQTDTLPLIAKLTGNTVDEIKKLSGLTSDRLSHNQKLRVYDRHVESTASQPTTPKKKIEKKPATPPKVTQDASKNKDNTPIAKVESENTVSSKVSQRNEKAIARLHPQVRDKMRKFIKSVYQKHQVQLVIVQDYRTYAQQDALYAKGWSAGGRVVTNAKGGQSNHNFALAVDVFPIWEDGLLHMDAKSDKKNIEILKKVAPIGKEIGLEWGGDWKSIVDNPHFQLKTGKSMAQLRQLTKDAGGDPLKVKYDVQ